jgi:outer membrane immunogenic protein
MKKILLGCAIAMCGLPLSQASAQDYCCQPQCNPCCYESDFNGLYIGGNVGAFTHSAHRNDLDGFLESSSGWSTNQTSVTAGLQLGYDWQWCNKLVGLVGDWNWVNTKHTNRNNTNYFLKNNSDWFSTIRARAGLAVCDALVYITGGAAVTKFNNKWNNITDNFHFHDARWGWTAGAGTELKLGCNFSLGLEVLFLQFDDNRRTFTSDGTRYAVSHSDSAWLGRVMLNYRFGDLCSCF